MEAFSGNSGAWDELIAGLPQPHMLQTWEWARVKEKYGWKARPMVWQLAVEEKPSAAAMVLERTISPGGFASSLRILYIPKGPNLDWNDAVLRQRALGGFHGHVGSGHFRVRDVALVNAGALQNPLVVGIDHFLQIPIREQAWRNVASQGGDFDLRQSCVL